MRFAFHALAKQYLGPLAITLCAAGAFETLARGQEAPPPVVDPAEVPLEASAIEDSPTAPAAREELYEELEREVSLLEQYGRILKKVVRLVRPTVVHIETEKDETPSSRSIPSRPVEEAGSGVIISVKDRYYVLTNGHVVRDASLQHIKVRLEDGRVVFPTDAKFDDSTDVAVLFLDADGLTAAKLGDSKNVEIGDFVLAVGSPFGLSHSVTYGIVSATGRRDLQLGQGSVKFQDFFQTDAAINPGNSGGPLLNLRGEVIGLNTAIASASGHNEGIGFAIPINMAMFVARQLIERGSVARGYLGVHLDAQYGPDAARKMGIPRPSGARITQVSPDSPAQLARMEVGDVILQYDHVAIEDDNHLVNVVSVTPIGKEVDVLVYRDGKSYKTRVKLAGRPQ
jgi:serine protease Do